MWVGSQRAMVQVLSTKSFWLASDHTHRFVVTFIDIYLFLFSKLPAMMGSVKWVDW